MCKVRAGVGLACTCLAVFLVAGCQASATSTPAATAGGSTLNVAVAAGLRDTVSIQIDELAADGTTVTGTLATLTDRDVVSSIVAALDAELPLEPRARCPERYRLHFVLGDGTVQMFGYVCSDGASVLRGAQSFWGFQDVRPPDAFQRHIAEHTGAAPP